MRSWLQLAGSYSNSEAVRAVRQIDDADKKDSETILKEALKKLAII